MIIRVYFLAFNFTWPEAVGQMNIEFTVEFFVERPNGQREQLNTIDREAAAHKNKKLLFKWRKTAHSWRK